MLRPIVWNFDGTSTYTNNSDSIRTNSAINFLSASTHTYYIGLDRRFIGIYVDLSTNGSYVSLVYSYWSGESGGWKKLSLIDSYAFDTSKYQRWLLPNDWVKKEFTGTWPHTATPPDNDERYWVRITATTVTTTAVISKIRAIPYVEYSTSDDVSNFLQVNKNFDETTKPTDLVVEDFIKRAEDRIDYETKKSWRFNAVVEDADPVLVDYNRYGFYPRHRDLTKVYSVQLWNGNSWNTLTEGRGNDYFVNQNQGMIYMTRLFSLPAVYGFTGRYTMWGYGEFKNSIKVDYVYGRDSEIDPEFYIVNELAVMMTSRQLLNHADFSRYIVSGSDKIPLSEKVRNLDQDIEYKLESLKGIFLT